MLGELSYAVDLMKWQNQPKTVRNAQNGHISTKMDILIISILQAWTESESSIQGLWRPKVNGQEYPIIGSQTPPVWIMAHFTSEPKILSPHLVKHHAPSLSEHEIRHNVVFNTEAYANI